MLAIRVKYICSKVLGNDLSTLTLESAASKVAQHVKLAMESHYDLEKTNSKAIISCPKKGCDCHWVV